MQIKILSWNIWIDGNFTETSAFLKSAKADIMGLQEVKDDDPERDIISFLTNLGYLHVFAPVQKTWGGQTYSNGPAIFSRYPIRASERYPLSNIDARAALQADIAVNKTIIHVFSTHLVHTHQKPSELQVAQADHLIKVLPRERTLVMGDFNATPESSAMRKMTKILVDTDAASTPTWSRYPEGCPVCAPRGVETRLDYILTTKDLKTSSFAVGDSQASDHAPISVLVEI